MTFLAAQTAYALPAFPGAAGFGSDTIGGRGGDILFVSNLNDSGPGSLRAAIDQTTSSGKRIIVFKVGGTISLKSDLKIKQPYTTIAGQTAPGAGIMIKGNTLSIHTHNVIVRGLRIRVGDEPTSTCSGACIGEKDTVKATTHETDSSVYNVIFDHNSFAYGIDEIGSTWRASNDRETNAKNITFQWNFFTHPLNCSWHMEGGVYQCHGYGVLVGDYTQNITIHHNYFAHNSARSPQIKGATKSIEVANNLIYNYPVNATHFSSSTTYNETHSAFADRSNSAHIINNFYKQGPNTTSDRMFKLPSDFVPGSLIYIYGNKGIQKKNPTQVINWLPEPSEFISHSQVFSSSNLTPQDAVTAKNEVLSSAGATIPQRDNLDQYAVNNFNSSSGEIIDCVSNCNPASSSQIKSSIGMPSLPFSARPASFDQDQDGIDDLWEKRYGLNPALKDSSELSPNGYTWIEEYVNSFFTPNNLPTPTPTPTPTRTPTPISLIGDVNKDNLVNYLDWTMVVNLIDPKLVSTPVNPANPQEVNSDIDQNGQINLFDLNLIIKNIP